MIILSLIMKDTLIHINYPATNHEECWNKCCYFRKPFKKLRL